MRKIADKVGGMIMFGRQRDPVQELARKAQQGFTQQAAQIDALRRQNQSLASQIASQNSQSRAERTMEELKRSEEHYAQVVMLAGYAGFFTLWTQTKSQMSLWMFASTGALISISLFLFVCYEIYKTWSLGRFYRGKTVIYENELNEQLEKIHKHWHLIFTISAGTGVVAGLSLVFWFVYNTILSAM
ncbi:MAG: hypothetical protein QM719_12310 [Thermomonas sp.]